MDIKRFSQRFPALSQRLQELHSNLLISGIMNFTSHPVAINQKPAIVFSPHQDDETLGCGGMIALKRAQKVPVNVVFLTDGQGGVGDPAHSREEKIQIRKREAVAALNILGVESAQVHFLDRPDGTLCRLSDQQRQQTVHQLAQLLRAHEPGEIYVPHRHDRHPDHEATYTLVQAAIAESGIEARLLQYPIWILWKAPLLVDLKVQEITGACRLSIQSVEAEKKAAIAVYDSQCSVLPSGFLKKFVLPYEFFWH